MTDVASAPDSQVAVRGGNQEPKGRSNQIRDRIVEYLAHNGASKVSELSIALGTTRDIVRYHLTALEAVSVVRSDIPPRTRARFTPFYSLTPVDARRTRVLPTFAIRLGAVRETADH
jgi:predicted ArsR family transcriptional regulator